MTKPAEILIFEYLEERFNAAAQDDVLYGLELHDTIYQTITKDNGVRVSDASGGISPAAGGVIKEFDVTVVLVCFARVAGVEKTERQEAVQTVFDIQMAVAGLLYADSSLGGRVCDLKVLEGSRGYDTFHDDAYAVANIPVIVNPRDL
jgi:hypothetical protein